MFVRSRLNLLPHRHSGRLMAHHHTSWAGLFFVLMLSGIVLLASGISIRASSHNPKSGSITLSGTVPAPPPTIPAVITSPSNGATFTSTPIIVSGTCPANLLVKITRNSTLAGSTFCTSSGTFSIQIELVGGENILRARAYDALDQPSPESDPVTVYLNPPPTPPQLTITSDTAFQEVSPGQLVTWAVQISGGSPPYTINWDWGDGTVEILALSAAGTVSASHTYSTPGRYNVIVRVTDSAANSAQLQLVVTVRGPVPPATTSPPPKRGAIQTIRETVARIGEGAASIIRRTPPPVAYSFPYLLFLLLLIMILLLIRQSIREARQARAILTILEHEKSIAAEKDNFIFLCSHYFRTPLTLIQTGLSLLQTTQKLPYEVEQRFSTIVNSLQQKIEILLHESQDAQILEEVKPPDTSKAKFKTYSKTTFWLPVVLIGLTCVLANYLFVNVAKIDISTINFLVQMLVFAIIVVALYSVLRSRQNNHKNRENAQKLFGHVVAVDQARSKVIQGSIGLIDAEMGELAQVINLLPAGVENDSIRSGYDRFVSMLSKFDWLTKVQSGQPGGLAQTFDFSAVAKEVASQYEPQAAAKRIKLRYPTAQLQLVQNLELLRFALSTVIENAVKFSPEGGEVSIDWRQEASQVAVTIADAGPGISKDQLDRLFKPFSRADSALNFSSEGIGLSLFLDKLIMSYIGGSIAINSVPGQGTQVIINFPATPATQDVRAVLATEKTPTHPKRVLVPVGVGLLALAVLGVAIWRLPTAWPIYALVMFMLVSFWLGDRFRKQQIHSRLLGQKYGYN